MDIFKNYKVDPQTGCWNWNKGISNYGYGFVRYQERTWRVHRLSWQLVYGKIPKGLHVCHHCDNRKCINPEHLFLGTAKDNTSDMVRKGRHVPRRKLTLKQVIKIKKMLKTKSQYKIATMFNVSRSAIQAIAVRKSWKYV